ncbi:MAG: hypothetical protein IJN82_06920, partial [Clostridia bacterium]|nr:hypothetical protein [Clostridia bacterium]
MLEKVEIYPTYLHICLSEDPNNTKYLAGLNFYVEAENGMRFETSQISTGGPWESYLSYELTSPYFYDIEKMDMVVSDAVWTDKEKQKAYVDLAANTAEGLPDGWSFVSAEEQEGERLLFLREERENHLIELDFRGYDP